MTLRQYLHTLEKSAYQSTIKYTSYATIHLCNINVNKFWIKVSDAEPYGDAAGLVSQFRDLCDP